MTATPTFKHARILLQVAMILASLCVLPIMVGMAGRSLAHDHAVAFEPRLDRLGFHL